MEADVQRATAFLAANGYRVTGVTFDLFETEGLAGVGLLHDGREVRFFIPNTSTEPAVIGTPQRLRA